MEHRTLLLLLVVWGLAALTFLTVWFGDSASEASDDQSEVWDESSHLTYKTRCPACAELISLDAKVCRFCKWPTRTG